MQERYPFFLFILLLTISCSSRDSTPRSQDTSDLSQIKLDSLTLFLSPENSYLSSPGKLEMLPDGKLAVLDIDQLNVLVYNRDGELATNFGRRGKGPGEFVAPRGLAINDSTINVIDVGLQRVNQSDLNGNFIQNYNIEQETSFFGFVATGSSMDYYTVANGYNGSLIGHHISHLDSTRYIGEAVVQNPPPVNDNEAFHSAAANGEVPEAIANDLFMDYAEGHLYVLIKAHNRLQKYTDGQLIWEVTIDLPVNDIIFKNFTESVQQSPNGFGVLRYVNDMTATTNNIYILWNGTKTHPQQVVKVATDGEIQTIYQLPDNDNIDYSSVEVDENQSLLYLASSNAAEVYTTTVPE